MANSLTSECMRTIYEYDVITMDRAPELVLGKIKQYEIKNDCGYIVSEYRSLIDYYINDEKRKRDVLTSGLHAVVNYKYEVCLLKNPNIILDGDDINNDRLNSDYITYVNNYVYRYGNKTNSILPDIYRCDDNEKNKFINPGMFLCKVYGNINYRKILMSRFNFIEFCPYFLNTKWAHLFDHIYTHNTLNNE